MKSLRQLQEQIILQLESARIKPKPYKIGSYTVCKNLCQFYFSRIIFENKFENTPAFFGIWMFFSSALWICIDSLCFGSPILIEFFQNSPIHHVYLAGSQPVTGFHPPVTGFHPPVTGFHPHCHFSAPFSFQSPKPWKLRVCGWNSAR